MSAKIHVSRHDETLRVARCLGLDRLGSPDDDEARWRELDQNKDVIPEASNTVGSMSWAATTFAKRDRYARNLARIHWYFLKSKDWVHSHFAGCYTIHPDSFTTTMPTPYRNSLDTGGISEVSFHLKEYLHLKLSFRRILRFTS